MATLTKAMRITTAHVAVFDARTGSRQLNATRPLHLTQYITEKGDNLICQLFRQTDIHALDLRNADLRTLKRGRLRGEDPAAGDGRRIRLWPKGAGPGDRLPGGRGEGEGDALHAPWTSSSSSGSLSS